MRRITHCVFMLILSAIVNSCAVTQDEPTGRPGVMVAEETSMTASVEAIDYDKRIVALKGPRGNVVAVKVGPEVKNFKQIKQGDTVTAKYYEATAIYVRKSNEPPAAEAAKAVQLARPGERPGAIVVDAVEITARVEDIDYNNRTVTLRGPKQTATLKVGKEVKRFAEVKKGDEVVVTHTEAVAINVDAAK
jgi:hypothetical protein